MIKVFTGQSQIVEIGVSVQFLEMSENNFY